MGNWIIVTYIPDIDLLGTVGDTLKPANSHSQSSIKHVDDPSQPRKATIPIRTETRIHADRHYIKGDLLHVQNIRGLTMETRLIFRVYKLVFNHGEDVNGPTHVQQVEVTSLENELLFVGDNQMLLSIIASNFPGCQPNSIYVKHRLHNCLSRVDPWAHLIFNSEDKTIKPVYLKESQDDGMPPPLWITPTFNGLC